MSPTYYGYRISTIGIYCSAKVGFNENTTKGFYLAEIVYRIVEKYPHKKATGEFYLEIPPLDFILPFKIRYE